MKVYIFTNTTVIIETGKRNKKSLIAHIHTYKDTYILTHLWSSLFSTVFSLSSWHLHVNKYFWTTFSRTSSPNPHSINTNKKKTAQFLMKEPQQNRNLQSLVSAYRMKNKTNINRNDATSSVLSYFNCKQTYKQTKRIMMMMLLYTNRQTLTYLQ